MTSLRKRPIASPRRGVQPYSDYDYSSGAANICRIVGSTCLAAFLIDIVLLGVPLHLFTLEWRITLLQQIGDRSIVLLLGVAMLLFGAFQQSQIRRSLSLLCLSVGMAFLLSSVLVIRDNVVLQNQAVEGISVQEQQIRMQLEGSVEGNSPELPEKITPEQLQQASQRLTDQATQVKESARQGVTRVGVASVGNLVVVGLGLMGVGRFGLQRR